ncbi:LANO_0E09362g1_1 [Lachancea nothofagi CBS 11611]|uniref:Urea amidolyase n=1 Tax=Lachancea nothofagi CBS 11611 TaxID=1266666 RepID=A0A1G4JVX3_9SACH|nr:LANO_0E09362g1_1 [Lachancea nothofagi CBS 11611]
MSSETQSLGWSVQDWRAFHARATPQQALDRLQALLRSQQTAPQDPAWISLVSPEHLEHQWRVVQSKRDKQLLPLYGVPVAVKDNIDVAGCQTTAACPSYAYAPERDSTCVALLRNAGAIILGKTNLDQFATGLVGTRSPYGKTPCVFSDKHVSGGSSAGSASVVGRGIVPLALGTDTAGSGRVPAALNNLVGLKPTKGLFSCAGVVPACKSLDCVSVFAQNLGDAQTGFKVMAQPDITNDEYSRAMPSNPLQRFSANCTIAIPRDVLWYSAATSENPGLYQQALDNLRATGAKIVEIDFEPLLELARCLYEGAWVAERYEATRDFFKSNPDPKTLDPTVSKIINTATSFDAADAFSDEYKRQGILQKVSVLLRDIDVLCVPTCPLNPTFEQVAAEPIKVNSQQGTWTNFVNLADLAALAVPAGFRSDGLSTGITLVGKKFTDYALLDLAQRYFKEAFPNNSRTFGQFKNRTVTVEDELAPVPFSPEDSIKLAVVGAHLKGLPLHWQLEKVNASYLASPKTSPNYKLYALPKAGPVLKPGLRRVTNDSTGAQIQLEVYSVPKDLFGTFISMVPEPLGIGSVELESGEWVKSFICEEFGYQQKGTVDITAYGSFKTYVDELAVEEAKNAKPFDTVLVANRGEIAVRIMKTLKKLKIKAVAVYSDPDKYSQHVTDADVAIPLKGATAAQTYLDIDKIIAAAHETGSQAIIPGYGFLSENATFSDRCAAEGIVFVGPDGDAIRKLGLKHSAREIAQKAGVPLVPGSGLVSSPQEAKEIARKLEYPIMVKSTAGGGGIGLQKVDSEEDIERVFETVQHQGKAYFGDSGVFLERFVENARHVEIQMMGDGNGKAIAIGERDCSLQRRNQKVIEETPAPNLSEKTRQRMRSASENLGALLKYKCAGTVEFIYDEKRDEFYFLEVNARLQVEHPITEMVTGLDLVEWMLKIAAGNPPDFDNANITVTGASIEARLYAENPVKDFRPSPGQLTDVRFPNWARVDTWISKGTTISAEYDPTLAKIIVHGKDRNDAIQKLNQALNETAIYGCITNIDYLRSIASSEMFKTAKVATKVLDSYDYKPRAFEVVAPGAYTTVQDYPGRVGHWRIGVPPSGPMDAYSFRLANRIVGNHYKAPAIEITLNGPKIIFHTDVIIALTGGIASCTLNDKVIEQNKPIHVKRGEQLAVGKLSQGCRAYLAIRGGIDVPEYLGSRSTFALGNMGGFNGRVLKLGDVLFLNQPELASSDMPAPSYAPSEPPASLIPVLADNKVWKIGVTCGPHGSPDFFKPESIEEFFTEKWKVHYNSNRFGVRLIGPKPKWARKDGGEGGLHPSNAHDYVYSLGAINFTGDEPVIITADGPSLGGFVCQAVVPEGELWKVGQVKPGDSIQFVPVSYESARLLKESQDEAIESFSDHSLRTLTPDLVLPSYENPILEQLAKTSDFCPKVTYRQAGDRYILVEYGENEMDLNISYRVNRLITLVNNHKTVGIVEMSQGVRSVLIEYNGYEINQKSLLQTLIAYEKEIKFDSHWTIKSKIFKLPLAFEDSETLGCVKRYQETIRSKAPWLPNNVDFVADINGITHKDVEKMLYTARFMVLGLGDVFLGAPCAVPLDPRHRLLGSKYNPSRTYTKAGTVGIGGMYMCIYAMDSPGGYQLVGRTIPIWDKLKLGAHSTDHPWLLTPFDQVEFYPVSEEELNKFTDECENGQFPVQVEESVFDHKKYLEWIQENSESIEKFQKTIGGEKAEEFSRLMQESNAELENSASSAPIEEEEFPEGAEMVYSEYSGRFWKPMVSVGDSVKAGDGLIVVEAMKTEMLVAAPKDGKVLKVIHKNGDMVEAGDVVVVLQ